MTSTESVEFITDCELMWCKVKIEGRKTLNIGSFYMPHRNTRDIGQLSESLLRMQPGKDKDIILCGDFNCPDISWDQFSLTPTATDRKVQQALLDMATEHHLTQIHREPTKEDNLLDLVFTTNNTLVKSSTNIPGISDHDMIVTDTYVKAEKAKKVQRKCYLFKRADWEAINSGLDDFYPKLAAMKENNKDINTLWETFKSTIMSLIDKNIPSRLSKSKRDYPWINRDLKKMMKKKAKLYKKAKKTKNWDRFRSHQRECRRALRRAEWDHVNNVIEEGFKDNNSKPFWNYIKSKRKDNIGVAPLKVAGKLLCDSKDKANALVNQFKSVFTIDTDRSKPTVKHGPIKPLAGIKITSAGVKKLLIKINPCKAMGPDRIPNLVLKTCAESIAPAMTLMFQHSVDTGTLPEDWLNANVAPIYKKGDRHQPENYRPVSLTSVSGKLLEHIICSQLMKHLDSHSILTSLNHGFRAGYSCETQLIVTMNDLVKSFEKGKQTDMAILDFSKAFDTVPHSKLLHKLNEYGVKGHLHQWFTAFLTRRHMKVVVDGETSEEVTVDSGVPQGTVLGPILFLCHINDLPDAVKSNVRLFADDCLLYREIQSQEDHNILQNDLQELEQWAARWGMRFNAKKCYIMSIKQRSSRFYDLSGHILQQVKTNPYLGVTISEDLKWEPHISKITGKASSTVGFLRRNLKMCPTASKKLAYVTLIRSTLEYAASAWDPHFIKDVRKLELVQHKAVRFIVGDYISKYPGFITSKLEELNIPTLEERRKNIRLALFYKVAYGQVPAINPSDYLQAEVNTRRRARPTRLQDYTVPDSVKTQSRNHCMCYKTTTGRTEPYKHSFFNRTTVDWNNLSEVQILSTSVDQFRQSLQARAQRD